MKSSSLFCHQVNRGNCGNKVSKENNFICAAGHGKGRRYLFDGKTVASILPIQSISSVEEREEIASNVGLSQPQQKELAEDSSEWVRLSLSKNSDVSKEAQLILATDSNLWVKVGLVWNPSLASEARHLLAQDQNPTVQEALSRRDRSMSKDNNNVIDLDKISPIEKKEINFEDFFLEQSLVVENDKTLAKNFLDQLITMTEENSEMKKNKQMRLALVYAFSSYVGSSQASREKLSYRDKIIQSFPLDSELVHLLKEMNLDK